MPTIIRPTRSHGDGYSYFGHEDGVQYRGVRQSEKAVKKHIEFLDAKVNGAPSAGNPRQWAYAGSIPTSVLMEFLSERGITADMVARNDGGLKEEFKKYAKAKYPHLFPKQVARARPMVQVGATPLAAAVRGASSGAGLVTAGGNPLRVSED